MLELRRRGAGIATKLLWGRCVASVGGEALETTHDEPSSMNEVSLEQRFRSVVEQHRSADELVAVAAANVHVDVSSSKAVLVADVVRNAVELRTVLRLRLQSAHFVCGVLLSAHVEALKASPSRILTQRCVFLPFSRRLNQFEEIPLVLSSRVSVVNNLYATARYTLRHRTEDGPVCLWGVQLHQYL